MAHAYTTSRGKNKQAKLNKRMDNQQNQEKKLSKVSSGGGEVKPKKPDFSLGHLGNSTINNRTESTSTSSNRINRDIKQITDKCSNSLCKNTSNKKLACCTGCMKVKYCCRDCQVQDWQSHKVVCKEQKQKLKEDNTNTNINSTDNNEEHNNDDDSESDNDNNDNDVIDST